MSNKSLTANFIKDSAFYLFANIVPMVVGIVSVPLYSMLFSPGEYGEYTIITTTISFANVFTVSWVVMSFLRFHGWYRKDNEENKLFSSSFMLMFLCVNVVYLAAGLFFIFFRSFIEIKNIFLYLLAMMNVLSIGVFTLTRAILQAERKTGVYALYSSLYTVLRILLIVSLALSLDLGIYAFFLADTSLELILSSIILVRYGYIKKLSVRCIAKEDLRSIVTYGFPLIGVLISHLVLSLTDRYMILFFRNKAEVGLYSMNYSITQKTLMILVNVMMHAATPIVFQQWETKQSDAQLFMEKLIRLYICIMLPATIGLSLLSYDITVLFLADEYRQGYSVMPYIAFSVFFLGLIQCHNKALEIYKKSGSLMYLTLAMALLNIVLNFILIPSGGYIGAAIATLISYAVYFIISYCLSQRYIRVKINYRSIFKLLLCNIALMMPVLAAGYLMNTGVLAVLLKVITGIIVYCVLLIITGEVSEEMALLKNKLIKRKI